METLKRLAKKKLTNSIEFYVRNYYKLLETDPRWLAMTREQIILEYYTLFYQDKQNRGENIDDSYEDPDFDEWDKTTEESGEDTNEI